MHVSLRREKYNARRGWDAFSGVLLIFDKHFSNYIQIPSKYSNIMLSIYEISTSILGADEDGRMQFVHNELLLYIFKWNREIAQFLDKNF